MDFDEVKWALTVTNHSHLLTMHREWLDLLQAHALIHQIGAQESQVHDLCVGRLDDLEKHMLRSVRAIWN